MFKCPHCGVSLLENVGYCQFCQATWDAPKPSPGAALENARELGLGETYAWVPRAYKAISWFYIADGAYTALSGLLHLSSGGIGATLGLAFGALTALIGVGLLLNVQFIRNIVTFFAFLNILGGVLGLLTAFFSPFVTGIWGIFSVLMQMVGIVVSCLLIFVIGETDQARD